MYEEDVSELSSWNVFLPMENGELRGHRRDQWDEIKDEETRLLRQMTIQESLQHLLTLQRAMEPQYQQTEELFRAARLEYLAELQRRLAKLTKDIEDDEQPL